MLLTPKHRALLELTLASFLFAGTAQFPKLIDMSIIGIVEWRSLVAVIALGLFAYLRKDTFRLASRKDIFLFMIVGTLLAIHWWTYFMSMRISSVAIGMTSLFTYPVMTVFIESLFFKSKIKPADMVVASIVVLGVFILIPDFNIEGDQFKGVMLGLVSALMFSLRIVLLKKYLQTYPSSVSMSYQLVVTCIILGLFFGWPKIDSAFTAGQLILLGIFFTAMPHTLIIKCLKELSAKTLGIISCMQPLFGTVLAVFVLSEMPSVQTVMGCAVILVAVIYEVSRVKKG